MADDVLRIANCSGFWGDRFEAPVELLEGGPIDVLTGDYLAELTMLILWRSKQKNADWGYARTFVDQMERCLGTAMDRGVRVVTNAGGLNPAGLAEKLHEVAGELGLSPRIAYVTGDDLLERQEVLRDLEASGPVLTANAYLGAWGIVEALDADADIVVCPRVTDASLVVGPAAQRFGWARDDWDRLASMVVAGHILECGAQATGGNYSFFTEVPGLTHPGFPIAEVAADGSFVVTKHEGTGGQVSVGTVTAQLLYEIAGPRYANPDVVARFDSIQLEQEGEDRVRVTGVRGEPAPDTYKVSVNTFGGFRNAMTFVLAGLDLREKAELAVAALRDRIDLDAIADVDIRLLLVEGGAQLRVVVKDGDPEKVGRAFSNAVIELALASFPGYYVTAPPSDADPYGVFVPATVDKTEVIEQVVLPDGETRDVEPVLAGGSTEQGPEVSDAAIAAVPDGETRRAPLGQVAGARSGDKGGNANVGIWARTDEGYAWLREFLTVTRLQTLYPEAADLRVVRYELPNLRALNFIIEGLLGAGVSSSTRPDPQAKSLGEELRAIEVDIPTALL